jgi:hypothetical protein
VADPPVIKCRIDRAPLDTLRAALPSTQLPNGERHMVLWDWLAAVVPGIKPQALICNWPRGGAKSTSAELSAVESALTLRRKFALYVSGTQVQADMHLQTVASLLEQAGEQRAINAYGQSKGWTQQMLRTGRGFNALSIGLDGNVRGAKLDELRPDLIILDDIDGRHDSPDVTRKKMTTILQTILPAGSADCAVMFVQNRIHKGSVMSQLLDGTEEALLSRVVSDEPAVLGLSYERRERVDGTPYYAVTGGEPTWPDGQSLAVVESQINEWGLTAVLSEAQHKVEDVDGGMYSHLVYRHVTWDKLPPLIRKSVWCDPAVTNTNQSDCNGIQADGVSADGTLYRLWSWEHRSTPLETLCRAIIKAVEIGATTVGVETDQGGDTWQSVFNEAYRMLSVDAEHLRSEELNDMSTQLRVQFAHVRAQRGDQFFAPNYRSAKAGQSNMSKVERGMKQLAAYERGKIVHVIGTHDVLESSLRRFPLAKPYDLHDAAYWSWDDLTGHGSTIVADYLSRYTTGANQ